MLSSTWIMLLAPFLVSAASISKLEKRTTGHSTWFWVGLGSCGSFNVDSDFIVALNQDQFDEQGAPYPGVHCGRGITITSGGKTAHATVMDRCPYPCQRGDLDMSRGLFSFFQDFDKGSFDIEWWFDGEGPSVPQQPETSTSVYVPPPETSTTVSLAPPETTTTTSSSSEIISTTSSVSSSTNDQTSETDTAAEIKPTEGLHPDAGESNLFKIAVGIINLGGLIRTAGQQ